MLATRGDDHQRAKPARPRIVEGVKNTRLNAEEVAWPKSMPEPFGLDLQDPLEDVEGLMVVLTVYRHAVARSDPAFP